MKGLRRDNLYRIRQWVLFYTRNSLIVAQLVPQLSKEVHSVENESLSNPAIEQLLSQIPWGHNREIVTRSSDINEALFYVAETKKYNWSRNVLINQIESKLWQRQGKAITNFEQTLPAAHSDLARELIKDPYSFDFLDLATEHKERDLE